MSSWMLRFCLLPVALILFVSSSAIAAEPLRYELRFWKPRTHLMDVTIHATGLQGSSVEFTMPDWAPGSYYIENYAANVQRFHAVGTGGKALAWRKTDSQTWQIERGSEKTITVSYQIFGDTLENNQAQYSDRHAFIGGPAVWMYLVNGKDRPIELSVAVPPGWKVATGMERRSSGTFRAADYDWFADAPLEISDFAEKDFEIFGTTYHVIVHDIQGREDFSKVAGDLQKAVQEIVATWARRNGATWTAPFKEYWFLFHISPNAEGGLEHLNSTQINFSTDWDDTGPAGMYGTQYTSKLWVSAHEFFHAWNVKRLRPRPIGPFDYSQMVHTPSLWISEGLTSYYGSLALARSGLITPQQYLDCLGKLITNFEQEPRRSERSIEDTSWDTWFAPWTLRQQTNLVNTTYSYYDGGQIVGHILDFAIRANTKNQSPLDDWMRFLDSRYSLPKPGFEANDVVRAASEVAGTDMAGIFRRYISGKDPLPYEEYCGYAGITVEKKLDPNKTWLGLAAEKGDDGHARITNVIPGSPAAAAGFDRGDVVVAVGGRAMDFDRFVRATDEHKPDDSLRVLVLRLGEVKEISVTLEPDPRPT